MSLLSETAKRTVIALLLPFVACGIQWELWRLFRPFVWFLFYPAVFFSSRIGGRYTGIASTLISAILVVYFFIPPQLSFSVASPGNLYSVVVFLLMGMLFSHTHDLLERANRRAAEAEMQARVSSLQDECDKAADELLEKDATFRSLFDNMLNSVVHARVIFQEKRPVDMEYISTNPAFSDTTGITEPVIGRRISEVLPGYCERNRDSLEVFGRVAMTGEPTRWEHYLPDLDRWFSFSIYSPAPEEVMIVAENVTDRKKAEQDLRESEERFRMLFCKAPLPLCFITRKGQVINSNDHFDALFGSCHGNTSTSDDWWKQACPDGHLRARAQGIWNEAVERSAATGGAIEPCEYNVTCRDGLVRIMVISGIMLGDDALAMFVDVTERRRKEEEALANRLKLEAALASMNDAVFISDTEGRFIDFNYAFATFHRFSCKEECARTLAEYPEFLDVYLDNGEPAPLEQWAVSRALRGETATSEVYTLRRRDTGETWVGSYSFAPIRDRNGNITGSVVTGRDITDIKRAENRLRESEASLKQAQRLAKVGNWMWDVISDVHYWSEEIYHIYGRDPVLPPAMYPEVAMYFTAESWKRLSTVVEKALARGDAYECDAEVVRPDGEHCWIVARGNAERDAGGNILKLYGTVQDITERKLAEEEIRQLNVNLEQRVEQRTAELVTANQELDSFAYAVSHDLRAPLRAMSGFSQALQEDYCRALPEEAGLYLEQINIASRHMNELIDGLLTLSRSTRGELYYGRVDLSGISAMILDELTRFEPERSITWEIEPGMAAHGDVRMLEVVMRNLIGNAWKYTLRKSEAVIRLFSEKKDGALYFCVADNGAGFDMEFSKKLFKPFQRLHRQDEFPGIGIGLATVQRIIHRHGGDISVTAAPGEGATFCFTLKEEGRVL